MEWILLINLLSWIVNVIFFYLNTKIEHESYVPIIDELVTTNAKLTGEVIELKIQLQDLLYKEEN